MRVTISNPTLEEKGSNKFQSAGFFASKSGHSQKWKDLILIYVDVQSQISL